MLAHVDDDGSIARIDVLGAYSLLHLVADRTTAEVRDAGFVDVETPDVRTSPIIAFMVARTAP